jgi:anti-anti-sigma regulatory factor
MLKITSGNRQGSAQLTLEGRLAGVWVKELEQFWRHMPASDQGSLIIDLRGVTFIEEAGKALLAEMWQTGAELIATGCCNKPMIEQITGSRQRATPVRQNKR